MSDQKHEPEEQISAEAQLEALKTGFIDWLGPITPTAKENLIRLFNVWRQSNLRRLVDLGESANHHFLDGRLVPGCTLTRSLFETVGVQYYVHKKIQRYMEECNPVEIHNLLSAAVFGNKDLTGAMTAPIQVLTAVDHLSKEFKMIRGEYDHLCEYAHPNLKGSFGVYVSQDLPSLETRFGINPQGLEMDTWGLASLRLILVLARVIDRRLEELSPKLIAMVEKHAPDTPQ